jgi:ribosomal protein L16 Arg81 hydroxylase
MTWSMFGCSDADGVAKAAFQQTIASLISLPYLLPSLDLTSWHATGNDLSLWVAPTGNTEQLHYDGQDNINFQVIGSKRWRLWKPETKFPDNRIGGGLNATCNLFDDV